MAKFLVFSGMFVAAAALMVAPAPSRGARTNCVVPRVTGKSIPATRRALRRSHCRLGNVRRAYSDTLGRGLVLSQRPRPRKVLRKRARVNVVVSRGAKPKPSPTPRLLLWNTLGSASEIEHSVTGPNLTFFDCHDPTTPFFGERCSTDISGAFDYVPGVSGGAAQFGGGPYFPTAREHVALLRESILDPERGTVEAWYRQQSDPVPFEHNPHRIFGGPYGLTGVDEVNLFSQDKDDSGNPRLHFNVFFGDEPPPYTPPQVVAVRSLADNVEGYPISALNGQWIHVAGVWDRAGIQGSDDTVRVYVNGRVVASAQETDWGTTPCAQRRPGGQWRCFTDIGGCNDTCSGAFAVDELKLWNYAKTDFS